MTLTSGRCHSETLQKRRVYPLTTTDKGVVPFPRLVLRGLNHKVPTCPFLVTLDCSSPKIRYFEDIGDTSLNSSKPER